jgi:hypothetical protein
MKSQSLTRNCDQGANFFGGSDARIVVSSYEGAMIRLTHNQNFQKKSRRSLHLTIGNPPGTRAHAAKKALLLLPIGRKHSRAHHRDLTAFMAGTKRFTKVYAALWEKLHARFSEYGFEQANRVPGSHVATHLDVCDRVPMRTGHLTQVSNRQIERSTYPNLCACQQARNAKQSNQGGSK